MCASSHIIFLKFLGHAKLREFFDYVRLTSSFRKIHSTKIFLNVFLFIWNYFLCVIFWIVTNLLGFIFFILWNLRNWSIFIFQLIFRRFLTIKENLQLLSFFFNPYLSNNRFVVWKNNLELLTYFLLDPFHFNSPYNLF